MAFEFIIGSLASLAIYLSNAAVASMIAIRELLRQAQDAARSARCRDFSSSILPPLEDAIAWLDIDKRNLHAATWQHLIEHAKAHGLLTQDSLEAFTLMAELSSRTRTEAAPDVTAGHDVVLMMYEDGNNNIDMGVAKQKEDTVGNHAVAQWATTVYTVGDHGATATVPRRLKEEIAFAEKMGAPPFVVVLIVLDGVLFYRDPCQWSNMELRGVCTSQELDNRMYFQLHGTDRNHHFRSGWYIRASEWEKEEPVAKRTRSSTSEKEEPVAKRTRSSTSVRNTSAV